MILDLHVHTSRLSSDSSLSILDLVNEASRAAIDGVCLTEHRGPWDRFEFAALQRTHEQLFFVNGMEIDSPGCHLTIFGLDRAIGRLNNPTMVKRIADAEGAFVVLAHPFRYFLSQPGSNLLFQGRGPSPHDLAELQTHPTFDLVDAIEVANGGTSAAENALALDLAKVLGKPTVGGSDAHSIHGLGRFVTVFEDDFHDRDGFLQALHAGRFHAAIRAADGTLSHCG